MNKESAELIGALIGLVRATDGAENVTESTYDIVISGLEAALGDADDVSLRELTDRAHEDKHRLVPDCSVCGAPCGRTADYDFENVIRAGDEGKLRLLGALGKAAGVLRRAGGEADAGACRLLCMAVFALGEDWSWQELQSLERELNSVCH